MILQDYQDVADADDLATLEARLVRFAHQLGFGIISGLLVVEQAPGRTATFQLGNTPEAYQSTFTNANISQGDPVLRRLKRLSAPFIYDQSMYVHEQAADLWDMQALFGYKTGIAMALHLPGGRHFVMGVDREQPLPKDDLVLTRMMADLQLLAVHAQDSVIRLLAPQTPEQPLLRLTDREIEILKWTAAGKSSWAVSQILNLSEHNVKYHIKRILSKMEVTSKHQAAARARLLGLI